MSFGGMGNMLKQAQQMQARMAKLKEELASKECEASAGGGAVTVSVSCDFQLKKVSIKPELLASGDADFTALAKEELKILEPTLNTSQIKLQLLLLPQEYEIQLL